MRSHRHFDPVPGMVSAAVEQTVFVLLSQLTQVPMSTLPSLSTSVQGMVSCPKSRQVSTPCSMSPH
jgi:hypothetical protein